MRVQDTQTGKLVDALKSNGFDAEIFNSYANEYNQDYHHLSITVRGANDRLSKLWDLCKNFELVIGKYANENEPVILIRKSRRFAELIEQEGINYDLLNRRETTPMDNCKVLTNEDWIAFYNETK